MRSHLDSNASIHGTRLTDLAQHAHSAQQLPSDTRRYDVIRSSKYTLLAADVRNLDPDTSPAERIDADQLLGPQSTALKDHLPTLVLFECVLAYIAPEKADRLLGILGHRFAHVEALSYDIALAGDSTATQDGETPPSRFGKVMLQNLEVGSVLVLRKLAPGLLLTLCIDFLGVFFSLLLREQMRKLSLAGAKAYPTIQAQSGRFVKAWSSSASSEPRVVAWGRSLFTIWSELDAEQRSR